MKKKARRISPPDFPANVLSQFQSESHADIHAAAPVGGRIPVGTIRVVVAVAVAVDGAVAAWQVVDVAVVHITGRRIASIPARAGPAAMDRTVRVARHRAVVAVMAVMGTVVAMAVSMTMAAVMVASMTRTGVSLWHGQDQGESCKNQNLRKPGKPVKEALFWSEVRFHRMVSVHLVRPRAFGMYSMKIHRDPPTAYVPNGKRLNFFADSGLVRDQRPTKLGA